MTYYADLSDYSYTPSSEPMLNAGWLARERGFRSGEIDEQVWDELVRLASEPVNIMRGLHDCELCAVESPVRMPSRHAARGFVSLGTGEIRVTSADGRHYAAPTLLLHYIEAHRYLPPDEFLQAVRDVTNRRAGCA